MKKFEDIFTKSKVMIISGLLAVLTFAYLATIGFMTAFAGSIQYVLLLLLVGSLLLVYAKGETSAQKALTGSILAIITQSFLLEVLGAFGRYGDTVIGVLEITTAIGVTIIFINHILLQIDHKGSNKVILINQIVLIITMLVGLAEFIFQLISKNNAHYDVLNSFGLLTTIIMITCIESRVQKYKKRRSVALEQGTWTEEERQKSKKIFKF